MRKKDKENEWIDERTHSKAMGFDERFLLRAYRLCKRHSEFFLGILLGIFIMIFIIK